MLAYMERPADRARPARRWRCSDDLADLAAAPHPVRRRLRGSSRRPASGSRSPARGWPARPPQRDVYDLLTGNDRLLFYGGIAVLAVAPAVIGIFWGAPLVARELETGTHRLAWNQSVTRSRWLATKLGFTVLATAVAVGILTLAITWWAHPIDGATGSSRGSLPSRLTPISFAMRGIVPVGVRRVRTRPGRR